MWRTVKQLQPVIWTKGTFLTPQHLQVQDRYIEDSLCFRLQALRYCPWGFSELTINQERLAEGQFSIARAAGIFSDGLLFSVPEADPAPPSRAIAECFEPETNSLDVYLAIPDMRAQGLNVSAGQQDTRYIPDVNSFRDDNSGANEKPIQIARKNLRFLVEGESRQGYSTLRVARVERTSAGTFVLDPRFIPPLLKIGSSEYLVGILRGLIEMLSAKSSQLSGTRRQKNQSLADFTASDIANFWLLYTVNSYLPVFNHLYDSRQGHPEELYSAMLSLAGSLTTFSPQLRPRDLPNYDHNELGPVLTDLDAKLRALLETVVPTNVVSFALKLVRPTIYATALPEERFFGDTRMYLAVSADSSEEFIIQKIPQLAKICSATHIDHLVSKALPGAILKHVSTPPSEVPVKLNYQYFSINQTGPAWEAVRRSRNFAAYVPGDFPNPKLEVLILLPKPV